MINEFLLLLHILIISGAAGISLLLGKEALVAFVTIQIILANLFVIKQTTIFGLTATTADAYAIGAMIGFNLMQEFYGKALAQKTIATTFFFSVFYAMAAQLQLAYIPHTTDISHCSFNAILYTAPSLVGASMIVFAICQLIDLIIYGFLKRVWTHRLLIVRNYISIGISQLVDTSLFSTCLWLLNIITHPLDIIIVSFCIKFIITLIATPLIIQIAKLRKKI